MSDIQAGVELDRAVLMQLGACWRDSWKDVDGCWKMSAWYYPDGTVACREKIPHYSTDLNAAFAAAEKAGLFSRYAYCQVSGRHVLSETVPVASWGDVIANADTVALAICGAILELGGKELLGA